MQGIGGLRDLGEQLGVTDSPGLVLDTAGRQEAQGGQLGEAACRTLQQFIGAGRQVALCQWLLLFQGFDINQPGERYGCGHGLVVPSMKVRGCQPA
ncbi:hypothetical protein D3C81_1667410 [compost metagenome]